MTIPSSIEALLVALASISALAGIVSTLAGFFGRKWWVFDLFSHFRVQYFLLLAACAILFSLLKRPSLGAASGLFALLNLMLILPLYRGSPLLSSATPACAAGPTYRLLVANVLKTNRAYDRLSDLIRKESPDILLLVEIDKAWLNGLCSALQDEYPFSLADPRPDYYGIALYSRIPLEGARVISLAEPPLPTAVAQLDLDGHPLALLGVHPPPPKDRCQSDRRNRELEAIAREVSARSEPLMVLGDLNISPWSPHFQDFLYQSGLNNTRRGFGIRPTWPANRPLFLTPIDHVLVSPQIKVHRYRIGPNIGSDHYPILLDFSLDMQ